MKKIIFAICGLLMVVSITTAQTFRWKPVVCSYASSNTRFGIFGGAGWNTLYTDYSDDLSPGYKGVYRHGGIFLQTGVVRMDLQYWKTGDLRQQSQKLPGTLTASYQGGDIILNLQPVQYLYLGAGVSLVDIHLQGSETNIPGQSSLRQLWTGQVGIEIPLSPISIFANWQTRWDPSGKWLDQYLPSHPFSGYDRDDWLHSLSLGIKLYLVP